MDSHGKSYSHRSDDPDQHVTVDKADSTPSKPSQLDYELDPLLRLEQHTRSTHQAIVYVIVVPLITLLAAGIILIISHNQGGPIATRGSQHGYVRVPTKFFSPWCRGRSPSSAHSGGCGPPISSGPGMTAGAPGSLFVGCLFPSRSGGSPAPGGWLSPGLITGRGAGR